jgi:hypothetical protein
MTGLYKISVFWTKGSWRSHEKVSPFYIVATSKNDAKKELQNQLVAGLEIKSVSFLGDSISGILFHK